MKRLFGESDQGLEPLRFCTRLWMVYVWCCCALHLDSNDIKPFFVYFGERMAE